MQDYVSKMLLKAKKEKLCPHPISPRQPTVQGYLYSLEEKVISRFDKQGVISKGTFACEPFETEILLRRLFFESTPSRPCPYLPSCKGVFYYVLDSLALKTFRGATPRPHTPML